MSEPQVLVLLGGDEAEAAVSRLSGAAVAEALREAGRRVRVHDLPRADAASLSEAIDAGPVDIVFPVMHGPWGDGGPLQELLAGLGLPFVGCDAAAARRCMDKHEAKRLAAAAGVPVIEGGVVHPGDSSPVPPPAVVKPVDDGSSVDLWLAEDAEALRRAMDAVITRRGRALVERWIRGREITIGLLEGEPLPVIEIVPASGLYDYQAKYERADTRYLVAPEDLPAEVVAVAAEAARRAWSAVEARDLARVDFIIDGGIPRMLEVNTMPGFTARSLLPRAARAAGYDLPRLTSRLVDLAAARGGP